MKEVKLVSKKENPDDFGGGNLDWEILEGQTQELEDDNVIAQAMKKMTIATMDPVSGYGVSINEFRGYKELVPFRLGVIMRIMRSSAILSQIYHEPIEIQDFKIYGTLGVAASFGIKVKIKQGDFYITV